MTNDDIDALLDEMSTSKPLWSVDDMVRNRGSATLQPPERMIADFVKALAAFPDLPIPSIPFPTIEDIERGKRESLAHCPALDVSEISAALALYDAASGEEQRYLWRMDAMTHYAVSMRKAIVLSALESWPFREE